ncbi:hypothetical protein RvY_05535 [Ramazzottius varieornatus]|uniref:Uncharacterized protein n=1 Tax=Ramazzottius varieornatus TaxID=947166 RepID=A0A1D1UYF2_RAMVA|nr:hypothetical protein RvY_05535 [Ramazzottius varieornatus]
MRTKHNGTIQAVTFNSDGAHRKARIDLEKLHSEIISSVQCPSDQSDIPRGLQAPSEVLCHL